MSGTDWSQMNDRGKISNYFIMLVVDTVTVGSRLNHTGWVAHVGFPATLEQMVKSRVEKSDRTIRFVNNEDGYPGLNMPITDAEKLVEKEENKVKQIMCIMECNIVREATEERPLDPFLQRYHRVVQAVAAASKPTYTTPTQYPGVGGGYSGVQNTAPRKPTPTSAVSKRELKRRKKEEEARSKQRILSMTDKEWAESQAEDSKPQYHFDESHAKALLNASLAYGDIERTRWNDKDPIFDLIKYYQSTSAPVFEEWTNGFALQMKEWADAKYPDHSDEEYLELVTQLYKYVNHFHYQDWGRLLLPELKMELDICTEFCLEQYAAEDADTKAGAIVNQQGLPFPPMIGYGGPRNFQDGFDDSIGSWD